MKILVGTKSDKRVISYKDGKTIADKYDIPYFETSAKEGKGVTKVFNMISKILISDDP